MDEHTPGPWRAERVPPTSFAASGLSVASYACFCADPETYGHGDECGTGLHIAGDLYEAADAHLIAAAPDLFAAAEAAGPLLVAVLEGAKAHGDAAVAGEVGAVVGLLLNAVAKARGQS